MLYVSMYVYFIYALWNCITIISESWISFGVYMRLYMRNFLKSFSISYKKKKRERESWNSPWIPETTSNLSINLRITIVSTSEVLIRTNEWYTYKVLGISTGTVKIYSLLFIVTFKYDL